MALMIKEQNDLLVIQIGSDYGHEKFYFKSKKDLFKVLSTLLDIKAKTRKQCFPKVFKKK